MAQFADVTVPKEPNGWLSLHATLSIAVGTKLTIQNTTKQKLGTVLGAFRVATSTAAPVTTVGFGVLMLPGDNAQLESAPAVGDSTWVISDTQSDEGKVAVET